MAQRVVNVQVPARWQPNIEHALLAVSEEGMARLFLHAHPDDDDRRHVEIVCGDVLAARMEPPNDEARSGHPLWDAGLGDVRWVGEVLESDLIEEFERRNRVHARHDPGAYAELRHWVIPLKGSIVEVVGGTLEVRRQDHA